MTVDQNVLYGPFAGPVELREGMVRRAAIASMRAARLQYVISIATAFFSVLAVADLIVPMPWGHIVDMAVTAGLGIAWVLAAINSWCCHQRADETRHYFEQYVSTLPIHR